jgi:copper(I)-binding protein
MFRSTIFACILFFPVVTLAELQISDAWIKNLPPSVPVRAGYMTIHNPQTHPSKIVAVSSNAFASVEIHRTVEKDGMVSMERVPELTIAPNATVQLAPGGLHLMMMQPADPIKPGMRVAITIRLEDGSEQNLELVVKK